MSRTGRWCTYYSKLCSLWQQWLSRCPSSCAMKCMWFSKFWRFLRPFGMEVIFFLKWCQGRLFLRRRRNWRYSPWPSWNNHWSSNFWLLTSFKLQVNDKALKPIATIFLIESNYWVLFCFFNLIICEFVQWFIIFFPKSKISAGVSVTHYFEREACNFTNYWNIKIFSLCVELVLLPL